MRTLIPLIALLSVPVLAVDLTVEVTNINTKSGRLLLSLFDSEESWKNTTDSTMSVTARPVGESQRFVFLDLPKGTYAVMLHHDENGNDEFDSNILGIPKEGYGFSNNGGRRGTPNFDNASITLEEDKKISIKMR